MKSWIKKSGFLLFAGLMSASSLVGCASKSGGNKIVLTVWCSESDLAFAKKVAESFKEEHADADYDFRFAVQGENDIATKILNDVETAPDVFSFPSDQISKLINGDALARIGGDRLNKIKAANSEKSIDSATVTYKGESHTYAFPYTDNTFFLYYNKSVLNENDVKSLDGILAKCSTSKKFAMPLNDGWYNTSFYFGDGLGYAVTYDDSFAETKITCDFDSEKGKTVTKALWEIVADKRVMADADDSKISAGLSDGSVVAAVSGIWNKTVFGGYLGENFGVTKLPTYTLNKGVAGERQVQLVSFAGYKLFGVGQYSKNKAAAMEFADYYTNKETQLKRFEERGFVPTNTEAKNDARVQADPCAKAITLQLEHSKTQKDVPSTLWTPMQGLGNAMITAATTGSAFNLEKELAAYVNAIEKNA